MSKHPFRRHEWIEHSDEGTALLVFGDDVLHIAGIAPEPVEASDEEFVTGSEKLNNGLRLGSSCPGGARDLLGSNDRNSLLLLVVSTGYRRPGRWC